jgi:phosphoglycerate kinase
MDKKTLKDINLDGKTVIHHCDFNIKLKEVNNRLVPQSDIRLKVVFPSIFYLLDHGCKIVFISYLERPGGQVVEELRLAPVAKRLSQLINKNIPCLSETIGPKVRDYIAKMKPGEMVMLENTRFYPGEEIDDDVFAKELAANGDLMVQDAFGHCHRVHGSVTGITRHIPSVAGFYLTQEVEVFSQLMAKPKRPFVLVVGGTKTCDKIGAIRNLAPLADKILIGGAVANNFLKAKGWPMAGSFMEEPFVDQAKGQKVDCVDLALDLMEAYKDKIVLPVDLKAGDSLDQPRQSTIITSDQRDKLAEGWAYLDIGPQTIAEYQRILQSSQTVFWDGPMGKYEDQQFRDGTLKLAQTIADSKATSVLAGGDTAAAAEDFDLVFKYTHVSIAGGAALEFLAGQKLPGIEALLPKTG